MKKNLIRLLVLAFFFTIDNGQPLFAYDWAKEPTLQAVLTIVKGQLTEAKKQTISQQHSEDYLKEIREAQKAQEALARDLAQLDALRTRGELLLTDETSGTLKSGGPLVGYVVDKATGKVAGGGAGYTDNYLSPASGLPIALQNTPVVTMMPFSGAGSSTALNRMAAGFRTKNSGNTSVWASIAGSFGGNNLQGLVNGFANGNIGGTQVLGDGVFMRPYTGGAAGASDGMFMKLFGGGDMSSGVSPSNAVRFMSSAYYSNSTSFYDPRVGMASSGLFGGRPAGNIDIVALFSSGASMFGSSKQFGGYIYYGGQVANNWSSFTSGGRLSIPSSMLSSLNPAGESLNLDPNQFQLISAAALRHGPQNTVWSMQPDGMLFFRSAARFSPVYWGGFVGGGRPGASVLAKYEGAFLPLFCPPRPLNGGAGVHSGIP